jgi:hypothetical protein
MLLQTLAVQSWDQLPVNALNFNLIIVNLKLTMRQLKG